MAGFEFETSEVAAEMAKNLAEHDRYRAVLGGIAVDRIAFVHANGKKKPASIPAPAQIKAVPPLYRAFMPDIVFVVVLYDEWVKWDESKQYAALLQQLLLIQTDGCEFEDGKLAKYDVLDLNFMVDNFGLHWTHEDRVRHPIEESPGTPTFSGNSGTASSHENNAVLSLADVEDIDDELDAIDDLAGDEPN